MENFLKKKKLKMFFYCQNKTLTLCVAAERVTHCVLRLCSLSASAGTCVMSSTVSFRKAESRSRSARNTAASGLMMLEKGPQKFYFFFFKNVRTFLNQIFIFQKCSNLHGRSKVFIWRDTGPTMLNKKNFGYANGNIKFILKFLRISITSKQFIKFSFVRKGDIFSTSDIYILNILRIY